MQQSCPGDQETGSLAAPIIDNEAIGLFGNSKVKIVLNHAISGFDEPVFTG